MSRLSSLIFLFFFFFNDTATTEIYTLSLHDALPIYRDERRLALERDDALGRAAGAHETLRQADRKSTRLNSNHSSISYAVFCLKKKNVLLRLSLRGSRVVFITLWRWEITPIILHRLTIDLVFFFLMRRPPIFTLFPYTTLFR